MKQKYTLLVILICSLALLSQCQTDDQGNYDNNTYSNWWDVKTQNFHLNWDIDFNTQKIKSNINIQLLSINDLSKVYLDWWKLELADVTQPCTLWEAESGYSKVNCYVQKMDQNFGDILVLPVSIKKNNLFNLTIQYYITNDSMSASFLTPDQTATKIQPYLFTQCEPIYARSLAPLQDTPLIKSRWTATVTTSDSISNVFMSAETISKQNITGNKIKYEFDMFNPVPSYLLAIVAGNVEVQQLGNRTYVITEPTMMKNSSEQLSDLEQYLNTVENYIAIPYAWKTYRIVIMPPSFPFGGMENPLLTFASPSIISLNGEKSGVTVAIHEIAHSWTGNMVTCSNWSNLWINEGFTVFLERQADLELFGQDYFKTDAVNGNDSMWTDMLNFGLQNSFSSLFPLTQGQNPDNSFSTVPYEKGFQLLIYIQNIIGQNSTQKLLNQWVNAQTWKTGAWQNFRDFWVNFVKTNFPSNATLILNKINWDLWVKQPGLEPANIETVLNQIFYTPLVQQAKDLAEQFILLQGAAKPKGWEALNGWFPNEQFIFLQYLFDNSDRLLVQTMNLMNQCYNFDHDGNWEILWRWYRIAPYVPQYQTLIFNLINNFLGSIGRQKMIVPIYAAFKDTDQLITAQQLFSQHEAFYHPIARQSIRHLLYGPNQDQISIIQ